MMTVTEANSKYNEAETAAHIAYREFWAERFKAEGVNFESAEPSLWHALRAEFGGCYSLDGYTNPAVYTGLKVNIFRLPHVPGSHWHRVTVKSETGFRRLIRRLHNKEYL